MWTASVDDPAPVMVPTRGPPVQPDPVNPGVPAVVERREVVTPAPRVPATAPLAAAPATYALTVEAEPGDATIRVLNIGPRYQAGMQLEPGRYHIEVSKAGYQTHREWLEVLDRDVVQRVNLVRQAVRPELTGEMVDMPEQEQEQANAPVIQHGSTVSIEYILKLDDGSTADSNTGTEPLVYVQGEQQILPALEARLLGMRTDETREVSLTPEEGYGPVHAEGFQTVPLEIIPQEARKVGARLVGKDSEGKPLHAVVAEITKDNAVVDLNHPLAGENLHFTIKILSIK